MPRASLGTPAGRVITNYVRVVMCLACAQRCLQVGPAPAASCPEAQAADGRCPLCRTELSALDVVAAPVPAAALAIAPGGDPADPCSPRRLVSTSPRRQTAASAPCRAEAYEEPMVFAQEEGGEAVAASGRGWSTKLQAILDELDLVNREHPGDKVRVLMCA